MQYSHIQYNNDMQYFMHVGSFDLETILNSLDNN